MEPYTGPMVIRWTRRLDDSPQHNRESRVTPTKMKWLSLPFLSRARSGPLEKHEIPGTLWQQNDALIDPIKSLDTTGYGRRVCFRNRTDQTLLLCWVDPSGNPHHFYALEPCQRFLRGRASVIIDLSLIHI